MRVLVVIPHYFQAGSRIGDNRHGATSDPAAVRRDVLRQCLLSLHQQFGSAQYVMQLASKKTSPANMRLKSLLHVVVCTIGGQHLLEELKLPLEFFHHHITRANPLELGFECHQVLRDRWGNYDFYAYLEDDLILHDPWLFVKLQWFTRRAGTEAAFAAQPV